MGIKSNESRSEIMQQVSYDGRVKLGGVYQLALTGYQVEVLALNHTEARCKILDLGKVVTLPVSQLVTIPEVKSKRKGKPEKRLTPSLSGTRWGSDVD